MEAECPAVLCYRQRLYAVSSAAEALMTPSQGKNKYQPQHLALEQVGSPFEPDRTRSYPALRNDSIPCSMCGSTVNSRGLNAYATLRHRFGEKGGIQYYRYLGMFKVRFCERCIPEAEVSSRREGARQKALIRLIVGLVITATAIICIHELDSNSSLLLPCVLALIAGIGTTLSAVFSTSLVRGPEYFYWEHYEKEIAKLLKQYKYELFGTLDLKGYAVEVDGVVRSESKLDNIEFEIEPSPFTEDRTPYVVKGRNGVQWVGSGTSDSISHYKGK